MAEQNLGKQIAQEVGANLVNAALKTPQGQAAMAGTVALACAAAPAIAVVAATGGLVYGMSKVADWLDF
jgi:hypothetical protein